MPPAPTREQQSALDARATSVALESGAGCGKTFVLTERFLAQLQPNGSDSKGQLRLDQLVAITFTDAAAREMRSRIRAACYLRLTDPARTDEQDHWLQLLREIDSARVSTIHSFCTSLLRMHAVAAELDPSFAVLDQGTADVLQSEAIDDVLRDELIKQTADAMDLAATFGLARLKQQIATLLSRRHEDYFEDWLNSTPPKVVAAWKKFYDEVAFPEALKAISLEASVDELLELLQGVEPQKPLFREAKQQLLHLLPKLRSQQACLVDLDRITESARVKTAGPYICTAKDWPTAEEYNRYKNLCDTLRKLIDKHRPSPWN